MSKTNYITVERSYNGYCVVLANVNGKKIKTRETFLTERAAVAKAIIISYKRQMRFYPCQIFSERATG